SLLGRGRDESRAAGTRPDAVPPAARTRCVPQPTDRQPARSRHAWSSIRSPAVGIREVHNDLQRGGVRAARTGALQAQRAQARSGRHVPVLPRSHATARAGGRRRRQGRAGERAHFHLPREHHVDHLDDHQHRSPAHYDHAARNYDHLLLPGADHLHHLVHLHHHLSPAHHDHAAHDHHHHQHPNNVHHVNNLHHHRHPADHDHPTPNHHHHPDPHDVTAPH